MKTEEAAAYVQAAGDENVRRHARRALREARVAVDEYSRARERREGRRGARLKLLLLLLAGAGAAAAAIIVRRRAEEDHWDDAPARASTDPVTQPLSAVPAEPPPATQTSAAPATEAAPAAEALAGTPSFSEDQSWKGKVVVDAAGEELGRLQDVYYDDESGRPEWAVVSTGSVRPRVHFVPLLGASWRGEQLHVSHGRQAVMDAPDIDDDGTLSASEEESLYRHYGMERPSTLRLSRKP